MAKPTEVGGLTATTPLRDAGLSLVLARLFDVRRRELALFGALGMDDVHDLRVATRRLRAALRLFGKRQLRATDGEVERLQDALGEVRDLHVQQRWLADPGTVTAAERSALTALGRDRARSLVFAERALLIALKRWIEEGAPAVERAAHKVHDRGTLAGELVSARLEKALRRVERARLEALASASPGAVHAFRIRLKQLRYLAELAGPALAPAWAERLTTFSAIQDDAGALHDLDVRIELLEQPAWSLPGLLERLSRERAEHAKRISPQLAALSLGASAPSISG